MILETCLGEQMHLSRPGQSGNSRSPSGTTILLLLMSCDLWIISAFS